MLDRSAQRNILMKLAEMYPDQVEVDEVLFPLIGKDATRFNLAYLDEHGLTATKWLSPISSGVIPALTKITARGLDFISDDGGLSEVLGVVTVKLHQETLTALIIERVQKADAPPSIKRQLIEKVRALPAEALQRVSLKAMEAGLDRVDVSQWLDKLLGP